ncbi:MAG: hypothetical protein Q9174_005048 [Haloplaca sp. 1 TL-2023]
MGLKDNLKLSECITLEFTGFNPDQHVLLPGHKLKGQVVIRNAKVLSVGEIRVTLYGISDAYIHRSISGIRADFYGRGFLFQEIKTLTSNPTTLQPASDSSHRLPFEFTMPRSTSPMTENEANTINKWKTKPSFAGASDMHLLPPTCNFHKKALLGHTRSSVSYRVDATCTKIKGGTSWLPQAGQTLFFSPTRESADWDPQSASVTSHHQLQASRVLVLTWHIPSVVHLGGAFPLSIAHTGVPSEIPVTLTALDVRLEGTCVTRGRSLLFGEKVSSEQQTITLFSRKDLAVPIKAPVTDLNAAGLSIEMPKNVTTTFQSFTVSQLPYVATVSFTLRVGNETISGKPWNDGIKVLPMLVQA